MVSNHSETIKPNWIDRTVSSCRNAYQNTNPGTTTIKEFLEDVRSGKPEPQSMASPRYMKKRPSGYPGHPLRLRRRADD